MTGAATALPADVTWEQFLDLLERDEYKNAELIDGRVVVSTPSWLHRRVVVTLLGSVGNWTAAGRRRGEVTFEPPVQITHNRGYLPDVAWYREERLMADDTQPNGPPDIAVEVLSPSTRTFDIVRKRADYALVGVDELWLIDPEGPAALVLRRDGAEFVVALDLEADGELVSPLLPGLTIRVGALTER